MQRYSTRTPIYRSWYDMIKRCYKPDARKYYRYWWRGISVCNGWRWKEGYYRFYEDMAESYAPWLTLDRIDNDWNYCKQNCRWATSEEQSFNKCTTLNIVWYTTKDIADKQWVKLTCIYHRKRNWWTDQEIFDWYRNKPRNYSKSGRTSLYVWSISLVERAKNEGISYNIAKHMKRSWYSDEEMVEWAKIRKTKYALPH